MAMTEKELRDKVRDLMRWQDAEYHLEWKRLRQRVGRTTFRARELARAEKYGASKKKLGWLDRLRKALTGAR